MSTFSITLDSTGSTSDAPATRALLFRAGKIVYGCGIGDAREIVPSRPATRLPGAPPYVRGLVNVRGSIVTVLDLARRFDPTVAWSADGFILLVPFGERLVGIGVDEVLDVRILSEPAQGGPAGGGVIRGVARVDDMDVILLDLGLLIDQAILS